MPTTRSSNRSGAVKHVSEWWVWFGGSFGYSRARVLALSAMAGAAITGCGGYQQYEPAAIGAPGPSPILMTRRLDEPGLRRFLEVHGAARSDSGWNTRQLALAALYLRPDLAVERARVSVARASEITAGARPSASAKTTVERATFLEQGKSSPWTVSLTAGLTYETGGKRTARIDRARAATLSASLRLQADAWRVASEARQAVSTALATDRDVDATKAIVEMEREVLTRTRARFAEGALSAAEVARVEAELRSAEVDETETTRFRTESRIAVSRAVGVSFAQLDHLPLSADPRGGCAPLLALRLDSLVSLALTRRYEVGAALADYAMAEADMRLAIGQQYPDLTFGPGLAWDQGITRWIFAVALQNIPAARNRGPIAEASARRTLQAAKAAVVQQSVVASVDSAVASCQHAARAMSAADALVVSAQKQLNLVQRTYQRGETGATEVARAGLALSRARRTHAQSVARNATAGVSLEDALGAWVGAPGIQWPDVRMSSPASPPVVSPP